MTIMIIWVPELAENVIWTLVQQLQKSDHVTG